jgi:transposase
LSQEILDRLNRLEQENQELKEEVQSLRKENSELKQKVFELESKLARYENLDSSNSSKPPSQDYKKKNLPKVKGFRDSGGQPGHKGSTLQKVEHVDQVIECSPDKCNNCGTELEEVLGTVIDTRQEIDIPEIKPKVTEYRRVKKVCPICNHSNCGKYPKHIKSVIQFGTLLKAFIVYLSICHKMPFDRLTQIIKDMLNLKISEGTIENTLQKALKQAEINKEEILKQIKQSNWCQSDETGIRVNGENWQLWTWCNESFSMYVADKSRGYEVIEENFGEDYQGILIHDCYAAQNKTPAKAHQHCLAHYQRDLKYSAEIEKCAWSASMIEFLRRAVKMRNKVWEENFDHNLRQQVIKQFELSLINRLQGPPLITNEFAYKLYKRFLKHSKSILLFMNYKDLPSTNNGSERAIRNAKIHKKISGCFRNPDAAKRHATILSTIETAKKQGISILYACKSLILGQNLAFQT